MQNKALDMDTASKNPEPASLPVGVFELPGEPAILINGVPEINQSCSSPVLTNPAHDKQQQKSSGNAEFEETCNFGVWLEGREIRKEFGGKYYNGKVRHFDSETGWYRVVYADGDFEDLDWNELEDVLVPLDITVPLKTLALKIVKKGQKPVHKPAVSSGQPTVKAKCLKNKAASNGGI